ncbi:hypothetical protein U0070_019252, partial [Myodes glareolus]
MGKPGLHAPQLLIKLKKLFPRVTIDFEFWTWIYTIVTYYADYLKSNKVTFHAIYLGWYHRMGRDDAKSPRLVPSYTMTFFIAEVCFGVAFGTWGLFSQLSL